MSKRLRFPPSYLNARSSRDTYFCLYLKACQLFVACGVPHPASLLICSSGGHPARDATTAVQAKPATTSLVGPGQVPPGHGRPRNKGNQRRRRSQDARAEPADIRASGSVPRPPRPKRAARGTDTSRSTGASAGEGGRAADVVHSGGGETFEPSREEEGKLPPTGLEEGENEKAFPALPPPASGRVQSPTPATARPGSLDYSALAERLAIEKAAAAAAAAAAASNPAGAAGGSAGGVISRLSVLPGFGDIRRGDVKPQGVSGDDPPEPLDASSTSLISTAENTCGGPSAPTPTLPPANDTKRLRAGAETISLRARLRERWFRLEATRKAQRQRESTERELMAAEDGAARSPRAREGGAGRTGAQTGQREDLQDPAGVAGDGDSSGGDGDGRAENSSSSSSGDNSYHERLERPRGSSGTTTTSRAQPTAEASGVYVESDRTDTAQGVEASSPEPRAVSAAGIAAIRRLHAAAAATAASVVPAPPTETTASTGTDVDSLARQEIFTQDASGGTDKSDVAAEPGDAAGVPLDRFTKGEHLAPCEGDGSDSGGVPTLLHGDRVHAACEAGMAGLLNDLLVRSGGRVADGKDKVRREGGRENT